MKTTTTTQTNVNEVIAQYAIDGLKNLIGSSVYKGDLHHKLFNEDYFIIGHYEAERFLSNYEYGIFGAISLIKDYELDNFGEIITDLSSAESVCNMFAYIIGEQLLNNCESYINCSGDYLTDEDIENIIEELKQSYN